MKTRALRLTVTSVVAMSMSSLSLAQAPAATATRPAEPVPAPDANGARAKVSVSRIAATDTRDARVPLAGMDGARISIPGTPPGSGHAGGLIAVPDNTLGQGESLQQRNERIASEQRLAEAQARLAERIAEAPLRDSRYGFGYGYMGRYVIAHRQHGFGPLAADARGLEYDNSVRGDSPGLSQRQYTEAARPRIGHVEDARSKAVIEYGKVAAPSQEQARPSPSPSSSETQTSP